MLQIKFWKKDPPLRRLGKLLREFKQGGAVVEVERSLPGPVLRIELRLKITESENIRVFMDDAFGPGQGRML